MTRTRHNEVRLTPGNWIALISLVLVIVGALIRLEGRLATIETKIQAIERRALPEPPLTPSPRLAAP